MQNKKGCSFIGYYSCLLNIVLDDFLRRRSAKGICSKQYFTIRDGKEYWKRYSNIRFTYSNIFEYSIFKSKIGIRFQVYSNAGTLPFPFSNNGDFPSISVSYCLRIYCMFSTVFTLFFSLNRYIWISSWDKSRKISTRNDKQNCNVFWSIYSFRCRLVTEFNI